MTRLDPWLRVAVILITSLAVGCASNVYHRLGGTHDAGTLVISLTEATPNVSVTVGGRLVCDDAHTEKITVAHVPVGEHEVVVSGGGGGKDPLQYSQVVEIEHGRTSTITIAAPSDSTGTVVASTILLVLVLAPLLLVSP